jgi:hypothetical protein
VSQDRLFRVGYIFSLDKRHNISVMSGLLGAVKSFLIGQMALLAIIEIIEVFVLEDDEAA